MPRLWICTPEGAAPAAPSGPPPLALYAGPFDVDLSRQLALAAGAPLVRAEGLADLDAGDAEGLTAAERAVRYPVLWRQHQERRYADFAWPGGETLRQFRDRCLETADWIASRHPAEAPVWVLAPAGVISQVRGHRQGVGPEVWDAFLLAAGETWEEMERK